MISVRQIVFQNSKNLTIFIQFVMILFMKVFDEKSFKNSDMYNLLAPEF